jgi:transposase
VSSLAVLTQQVLEQSWHSGALFAFRGKRGDLVKLLWHDQPQPKKRVNPSSQPCASLAAS